ncbi:MAG: MFS transporter [Dehalococcoidia bacterium]
MGYAPLPRAVTLLRARTTIRQKDATTNLRRSPLAIIYFTVFIDLMGFGIILPQLPFHVVELGATGLGVGATLTAYSGGQFISAPILGRLSDRFGRRPVILATLLGSGVSMAASGFAPTLALLIGSRALAGAFGGSVAPAQAYIADSTEPQERARYMAGIGAAIGMGLVFGPVIGALLSPLGFGAAAFAAAGMALANGVFAYFKLPESNLHRQARSHITPGWLMETVRRPNLALIFAAAFLAMFAFVGMEATFALLGEAQHGLTPLELGVVLAYIGVLVAVTQLKLVGPINARIGERRMAAGGALLIGTGLVLLPVAPALWAAATLLGVVAIGQGLLNPGLVTLTSLAAAPGSQGGTLGLGQSFAAAARVAGPVTAGWLFDVDHALSYLIGGVAALAAVALLASLKGLPSTAPPQAASRT